MFPSNKKKRMKMKKLLWLALFGSSLASAHDNTPSPVPSAPSTEYEYNYSISYDDWKASFRDREDTWHVELGHTIESLRNLDVTYRYADLGDTVEQRFKFTYPLFSSNGFSVASRLEYRAFDSAENHWRYRWILGYKKSFQYADVWVKLQPRWGFKDESTAFDARDQVGVDFKFGDLRIGPFVERYAKTSWRNHSLTVVGTNFSYKL